MISIVLPTYNGEKYINEAVQSILNQSFQDWELVIVDDCSTDSTAQIVDSYAETDKRIRVIHNKVNMKLPKSLNIGFEVCQGDFFTWTSDDNMYKENALEKMISIMQEKQEVGIVYALFDIIDENGHFIKNVGKEECNIDDIYEKNPIGACFLYRREVHEKLGGFDCSKFLVEDYDFWIRANRYYSYYLVDECLYQYRNHGKSLSSNNSEEITKRTVDLLERELQYCTQTGRIKALRKIVDYYFGQRKWKKVKKYLKVVREISSKEYYQYPYIYRIFQYL